MRVLAMAFVAVVALAGCGGDDTSLDGASTEPVVVASTATETALLTDIDVERGAGLERITFTFSNVTPGYDVRYVEPPLHADGSGAVVTVAGTDVLRVRMEPALDADLTKEGAPLTYTGPQRFSPDTDLVQELARIGGFEAVLTWAIGLDSQAAFRVTTSDEPPRLVVELQAG